MSRNLKTDLLGVLKGIQMIATESIKLQETSVKHLWVNSSVKNIVVEANLTIKQKIVNNKSNAALNVSFILIH